VSEDQLKLFEDSPQKGSVDCVFCSMVRGETKSYSVFSDSFSLAFLDRKPVFKGHCLVIPLKHYETLSDLPTELIGKLFSSVQLVSKAVQRGLDADGTFVAMNNRVSQSVPHAHIHVVPRRFHDGLRGFFWPRQTYADERDALEVQKKIREAVSYFTQNAQSI
jgi:histidine triad (HIT) family protein